MSCEWDSQEPCETCVASGLRQSARCQAFCFRKWDSTYPLDSVNLAYFSQEVRPVLECQREKAPDSVFPFCKAHLQVRTLTARQQTLASMINSPSDCAQREFVQFLADQKDFDIWGDFETVLFSFPMLQSSANEAYYFFWLNMTSAQQVESSVREKLQSGMGSSVQDVAAVVADEFQTTAYEWVIPAILNDEFLSALQRSGDAFKVVLFNLVTEKLAAMFLGGYDPSFHNVAIPFSDNWSDVWDRQGRMLLGEDDALSLKLWGEVLNHVEGMAQFIAAQVLQTRQFTMEEAEIAMEQPCEI